MTSAPWRRVLITGGAGFIGSHLAERLHAQGCAVTALDDLSTGSRANLEHLLRRDRFHFVEGSVLDRELIARLVTESDAVFHLAAAVGVKLIVERPLASMLTNIHGTENVLEAAAAVGARVLVSSTSEIYGKSTETPYHEDDDRVLGPTSRLRWSYSTAKAVDEILAYGYHRERALPVVVARLFNTVGPRQTGRYGMVLPRFVGQALRREPLTVHGDGTQSRVFTYVGDVVQALMRLLRVPEAQGQAFNVAGREEVTINELARRVLVRTGSTSTVKHVPYVDVYGDGFEDTPRRVAATSKLEQAIDYRCETPLDTVIDHVVEHERRSRAQSQTQEDVGDQVALSPVPR